MDSSQSDKARLLESTRALLAEVNEAAEDWSTAVAGHDSDDELAARPSDGIERGGPPSDPAEWRSGMDAVTPSGFRWHLLERGRREPFGDGWFALNADGQRGFLSDDSLRGHLVG